MRPHRRFGDGVTLHFLERGRAGPGDDQLAVGGREQQEVAGAHDRSILRLPRLTQPQRFAGRGVDGEELAAVLVRQAEQRRSVRGRRAHIHRHLFVAPSRRRRPPFTGGGDRVSDRRVVETCGDDHIVDDERRDGILFVRRLDRHVPEQAPIGGGHANELGLRLRDDLPRAADRRDHR